MSRFGRSSRHLRIGVYIDFVYHADGGTISVDQAVVKFITELAPRVDRIVLFGRLLETGDRAPYEIPASGVTLVPLPHYESVAHVRDLVGSARVACRTFADSLDMIDVAWLFGPHPMSIAFSRIAKRHGTPVVLGVRQDFPRYIAGRVSPINRTWALPVAWAHEVAFRASARKTPAVVVGSELALKYKASRRPHIREIAVSLVSDDDIVSEDWAGSRDWETDELRVLSVGRLAPEKNPQLLVDVIGELHASDPRWRLDIVGDGPMLPDVAKRANSLNLSHVIRIHGHVANGAALNTLYRDAHAFLHVSLTEGLPQVLFEAAAAGLPIVATDVGGVGDALLGGRAGLIVAPQDAHAAAAALQRLGGDPALRDTLISGALEVARLGTLEHSHDKILELFSDYVPDRRDPHAGAASPESNDCAPPSYP